MTSETTDVTDSPPAAVGATALPPANRWERLGLAVLLLGTAVAYLWNITVNAMGNNFYAAASWSGSRNWKATLFGSLDPANFITVDKPPVSQWVMGVSGHLFGFSSASMLVPEALMAVASVALLYATVVRTTESRGAGLLAGLVLAVTPVSALMFRFNNPDAVMVLLMTAGAYCTARALRKASALWLTLAGVAMGFAFLAKMLEGLMVLPALVLAYLLVAPTTLRARLLHLLGAAAALVVSSGWFVLLTILWPESSRPYLAGSTDNTFMNLVFGYNGFARIVGRNHHGPNPYQMPPGFEMPHRGFDGSRNDPGVLRLFRGEVGFEISWLLPAALLAFAFVLISRGRAPRTDLIRGVTIVFGLWMIIDGVALSAMKGGMHAYYTFAIAPAVAGMFAVGVQEMWRRREAVAAMLGLIAMILAAAGWGFALLRRNMDWQPWLAWIILGTAVVASIGMLVSTIPTIGGRRARSGRIVAVAAVLGVLVGLGGSTAYAVATLPQRHVGGSPSVGPASPKHDTATRGGATGRQVNRFLLGSSNADVDRLLSAAGTTWSAAVERSSVAAVLELSSRTPVMAIGGFTLEDPAPTLPQFQEYVRDHRVRYYIGQKMVLPAEWRTGSPKKSEPRNTGVRMPGPGGWWPGPHRDIADWVHANFTATDVGDMTVYDLSRPTLTKH